MMKLLFTFYLALGVNVLLSEGFFLDDVINVNHVVDFYNSIPGLSWKAGRNGLDDIAKISEMKSKLGWKPRVISQGAYATNTSALKNQTTDDLPKNYDSRTAYPQCTTIPSIKNQGNCGSCWAVAVASAFSDRICIHSNATYNYNVSANQLLACDKGSDGCNGGYLDTAWEYVARHGLVTGGDYGSNEGCQPYTIPPNSDEEAHTPKCLDEYCPLLFKARNATFASAEATDEYILRKEIYENGPLVAGFTTYLTFHFYESGIYSKFFIDLPMGGHAVRVIGWGEEEGEKYWLVANSWGKDWGENGTFRIRRGTDECDIESNMMADLPRYK